MTEAKLSNASNLPVKIDRIQVQGYKKLKAIKLDLNQSEKNSQAYFSQLQAIV